MNPLAKVIPGEPLDGTNTVQPPSLDESWEFYEHQILPRRFVGVGRKRAEPGESEFPTRLYSMFDTSLDDMGGFGIGVGKGFNCKNSLKVSLILHTFFPFLFNKVCISIP